MLQHGAYTLLIDSCYDRERFPTLDEAIDWAWASTKEEVEAVEFVLRRFFEPEGGLYVQKRIEEELNDYHQKALTNKRIAQERETKRKEKSTKRERSVNEPPPNHKPITINHKPIVKTGGKAKRFVPPSIQEITLYCSTRNNSVDPERFIDHYTSNGWKVGKNSMKDWKASVRTWEKGSSNVTRTGNNAEAISEATYGPSASNF